MVTHCGTHVSASDSQDSEGEDLSTIRPSLIRELRNILDLYPDDGQILKVGLKNRFSCLLNVGVFIVFLNLSPLSFSRAAPRMQKLRSSLPRAQSYRRFPFLSLEYSSTRFTCCQDCCLLSNFHLPSPFCLP